MSKKRLENEKTRCPVCRKKYSRYSCIVGGKYFYLCHSCLNRIFQDNEQRKQTFLYILHKMNTIREEAEQTRKQKKD